MTFYDFVQERYGTDSAWDGDEVYADFAEDMKSDRNVRPEQFPDVCTADMDSFFRWWLHLSFNGCDEAKIAFVELWVEYYLHEKKEREMSGSAT